LNPSPPAGAALRKEEEAAGAGVREPGAVAFVADGVGAVKLKVGRSVMAWAAFPASAAEGFGGGENRKLTGGAAAAGAAGLGVPTPAAPAPAPAPAPPALPLPLPEGLSA
jgi:hypothetical protein